jgi:hypothetical protein
MESMPTKRVKWVIAGSLLGILLCIAAGAAMIINYQKSTSCYQDRPPLRRIDITIDKSQGKQFIQQLKNFAESNGFEFELSVYTPNGELFSVWMRRKDVEIVVVDHYGPTDFQIRLYNNNCIHPTVASDLDGLVNDLRSFITKIPDATITEER